MSPWLLCSLAAALAAFVSGRPIRELALRLAWLDRPTARKEHRLPVPYGGGLALAIGIVCGGLLGRAVYPGAFESSIPVLAAFGGLALTVLAGSVDDFRPLGPWAKMAIQSAIGLLMWRAGLRIEILTNPFGEAFHLGPAGALLTILWFVALMNAMNLIDGLDGLATGIAAIAGVTILAVSFGWSQPGTALLAAVFVGACAGFLPHNLHPARMFLGDGGSWALGFCLAALTIQTSAKSPALLALLIPMVALLLPIADTAFAFARRLAGGQHPFQPDRRHLHHRLLAIGLSHQRVVVILCYLSLVNGVMAWLLSHMSPAATLAVFAMLAGGFLLMVKSLSSLEQAQARSQSPRSLDRSHDQSAASAPSDAAANASAPKKIAGK